MTDYSKMTDDELNEAIFRAKGWVALPPPAVPMWQRPTKSDVDSRFWYFSFPPDYTHDWRLAGELLEEMMLNNQVSFWKETGGYSCELSCFEDYFTAPTPQRAICEAWLAWKADE